MVFFFSCFSVKLWLMTNNIRQCFHFSECQTYFRKR